MTATFELVVEGEGVTPHSVSISKRPYSIGRGPGNDLVVPDGMVSWEHLKVWSDRGLVWCADAGSTNGTYVNGEKISGTVQLKIGDRITVGSNKVILLVQLHGTEAFNPQATNRSVALEEIATGLQHPFRSTRFIIGSASDADLRIPSAKPYHVECAVHGPDEIWMLIDNEDRPLELGSEFDVAGVRFRLVEVDIPRAPTIQPQKDRFPYRLGATLDGPTGPMAELENITNGKRCRIDAETRAILLFLLGKKYEEDRQKDVLKDEIGWCPDDDVIVGVWGRAGLADGANRLKVLVHRLRAEIERAGFDPWFIERRRRFIRVRIREFQTSG
ncbi:MAG: FHA domain-containing protein [Myxococcota bacterium]